MEKEPKKIVVDQDGVLTNLVAIWLQNYRIICPDDQIDYQDITDYNIYNFVKNPKLLDSVLKNTRVFADAHPIAGAIAGIVKLRSKGHEIIIATKLPNRMESDNIAKHKLQWLKKYLAIGPENVIFTGRKELIDADIIIEDRFDTALKFLETRQKPAILLKQPWNSKTQHPGILYAENWNQIIKMVGEL